MAISFILRESKRNMLYFSENIKVGHRAGGLTPFHSYPFIKQLLADLENNKMFSDDLECQKLLMEAMKYHLLPERRPLFQSPRTKPRKSTVGSLYAVGGMDATKGRVFRKRPPTTQLLEF